MKKPKYNFPKWNIKPVGLSVDTDFDRVPNLRDCQPFNKWKQDKDPGDWMDTDKPNPKTLKVKPNATISEVKRKAKRVVSGKIGPHYEYTKGNCSYLLKDDSVVCTCTSEGKFSGEITGMFVWDVIKRKWSPISKEEQRAQITLGKKRSKPSTNLKMIFKRAKPITKDAPFGMYSRLPKGSYVAYIGDFIYGLQATIGPKGTTYSLFATDKEGNGYEWDPTYNKWLEM